MRWPIVSWFVTTRVAILLTRPETLPIALRLAAPVVSSAGVRKRIGASLRGVGTPFVGLPLAMPIVVASSLCVWSATAVIARSPM